jgi:hypothetical protein
VRLKLDNGVTLTGREAFATAFEATVRRLQELGATVWVVRQVPPQLVSVPSALAKASYFGRDLDALRRPYDQISRRLAFQDDIFARVPTVRVLDSSSELCPNREPCRIAVDGHALYIDNNHLSTLGALSARSVLKPYFRALDASPP